MSAHESTSVESVPAYSNGGKFQITLNHYTAALQPDEDLLALDAALARLAHTDPLKARLVELRYFAGMTGDQAAEVLGLAPRTADRHWVFARAWLRRDMDASWAGEEK